MTGMFRDREQCEKECARSSCGLQSILDTPGLPLLRLALELLKAALFGAQALSKGFHFLASQLRALLQSPCLLRKVDNILAQSFG